MTYKELLIKDHPELSDGGICGIIANHCPDHYYAFPIVGLCTAASSTTCEDCWNRDVPDDKSSLISKHVDPAEFNNFIEKSETFIPDKDSNNVPHILDSGTRREFETGAVRDIQEGKGRCDLLPFDVVSGFLEFIGDEVCSSVFDSLYDFVDTGCEHYLYEVLSKAGIFEDCYNMLLEVSKHFEEGAKKYGDSNWQKGIPIRCYIDSAVRHYLKYLRGDKDEPHDRAFYWNILCAIWTCEHKPELNDYKIDITKEVLYEEKK